MSNKQQGGTAVKRLAAAIIGAAASFSLFAAYMVIPPAGLFSGLLAPFPASYLRLRHGRMSALTAVLGATTLMTYAFGLQAGVLYLAQCATVSLLMPELLARGFGAARSMAWATGVNLLIYLVAALIITFASGQNVHLLVVKEVNESITQAIAVYEKTGIKGDELAQLSRSMKMAADLIARIYPSLMTIMLVCMAGANLALIRRFVPARVCELSIGEFNSYRNPEQLIWLLIVAGFALLAGTPLITVPALNVIIVLSLAYFLQGMAVILSIIARQSLAGLLRTCFYLMLLFQPYLAAMVAAIGIFDLWGDFRTPRKQENL